MWLHGGPSYRRVELRPKLFVLPYASRTQTMTNHPEDTAGKHGKGINELDLVFTTDMLVLIANCEIAQSSRVLFGPREEVPNVMIGEMDVSHKQVRTRREPTDCWSRTLLTKRVTSSSSRPCASLATPSVDDGVRHLVRIPDFTIR